MGCNIDPANLISARVPDFSSESRTWSRLSLSGVVAYYLRGDADRTLDAEVFVAVANGLGQISMWRS